MTAAALHRPRARTFAPWLGRGSPNSKPVEAAKSALSIAVLRKIIGPGTPHLWRGGRALRLGRNLDEKTVLRRLALRVLDVRLVLRNFEDELVAHRQTEILEAAHDDDERASATGDAGLVIFVEVRVVAV